MTDVLRIIGAPLIWFAAFSAVYGLHGLICGHGIEGTVLGVASLPRVLMVAAYLGATALMTGVLWVLHARRFSSSSPFVTFVSRATGWTGLVATVWTLLPTVATTYCL